MSTKTLKFAGKLATAAALAAVSIPANAIPTLTLGIVGGTYDSTTQTIIASGNPFQLVAILSLTGQQTFANTGAGVNMYISAALVPQTGPTDSNLGSFSFAGTTVQATADMFYGTPPLDSVYQALYGDLQTHGIFETFFSEFQFQFDLNHTLSGCLVDTQTNPGLTGCTLDGANANATQYYHVFDVNVANLLSVLHFDLYDETTRDCKPSEGCDPNSVVSVDDFAPFSHDAQSSGSTGGASTGGASTGGNVPEPGSLSLLGLGLLGAGYARRRAKKA